VLHGRGECGQGRLALGLRAAALPSAFLNPATSRSSCSRLVLSCDIIPTLRLLSPIVLSQSVADTRRRRHVRALARSLPDDALAFLAHTALQPPASFDGNGGAADSALECELDIDDADEGPLKAPSVREFESSGQYKGVIEKNIYGYGDLFTVKFTHDGQQHFVGSFLSIEEARAARDSAVSSACAAAAAATAAAAQEIQTAHTNASANVFTGCELEAVGGGDATAQPPASEE
jgi:hypothetical protein